jgi:hypothetical protein
MLSSRRRRSSSSTNARDQKASGAELRVLEASAGRRTIAEGRVAIPLDQRRRPRGGAATPAPRPDLGAAAGFLRQAQAAARIDDPFSPPVAQETRPQPVAGPARTRAVFSTDGQLLSLSNEKQEVLYSVIGLVVKLGLVAATSVSLVRLAIAYQQRMDRQGEIGAVLQIETARMARARERFDQLFSVEGEQRLIREQSQWIAPNRLRVVWREGKPFPTVETTAAGAGNPKPRP